MFILSEIEFNSTNEGFMYLKELGEYETLKIAKQEMREVKIKENRQFNIYSTEASINYWYNNEYCLIDTDENCHI